MLTTNNRISHALTIDSTHYKVTTCGAAFTAWVERGDKYGVLYGVDESLPDLHDGMVDCMTCIVRTGTS